MALEVGSRIAHYDVTALIGEGGMGQVYQATDTKLNRQVALKILPEAFATDPDRLARFQREAQVLASLHHAGIAVIYGLEESGDTRALVLELVEGPTLAARIAQGPIAVDEALPIAKQIRGTDGYIRSADGPRSAVFSPDGTWVAYWAGGQLWKVIVSGGTPVGVAEITERPMGMSWESDDVILYGLSDGIWRIAASGGTPERVIAVEDDEEPAGPALLPGGRSVLFTVVVNRDWDEAQVVAQSLDTGERTILVEGGRDAILGPYSVTAKIGEGGVGEVYRARDNKLDRDVALKVLPDAFTADPDRLARFETEAKVLASLNHPNIGHIYGLEEAVSEGALTAPSDSALAGILARGRSAGIAWSPAQRSSVG